MPSCFSKCLAIVCFACCGLGTAPVRAVVPPRPDSGATPPAVSQALRKAGFGRVSRPWLPPHALAPQAAIGSRGERDKAGAQKAAGSRALPVLLGDTSDRPGVQAAATIAQELFGAWPTGSFSDYYAQASYGALQVTGAVHGWYRLDQPLTYYQGAAGCNGLCSYPQSAGGFVRQLVAKADAAGVAWGDYDNDGPDGVPNSGDDDGYVDAVVVIHPGAGGECGGNNSIWSHSFCLRGWGISAYQTSTPSANGGSILVDDYIIQPELSCSGGLIEIGVFCHEYGHALGLPDLYDTQAPGEGAGKWCLMGAGSWGGDGRSPYRPVHPSAWAKAWLGWVEPEAVRYDTTYALPAVESTPLVRRVWTDGKPTGEEYFLIENRQRILNDALLPAGGLLIWHVDEEVIAANWAANKVNAGAVYGVALEQADGLAQLEAGTNRGDAGDPWSADAGKARFAADTAPASLSNAGGDSGVEVRAISAGGATMTAEIVVGVDAPDLAAPAVALLAPAGGERWAAGGAYDVRWQASDAVGVTSVTLLLSRDGGATYPQTLAAGLANTGSWTWQTPSQPAGNLKVRAVARDAAENAGQDESDAVFALVDLYRPGVLVLAPNGGEIFAAGTPVAVAWSAADNVGVAAVDVFLSTDGGATFPDTVAVGLPNSGAWTWPAARRFSNACRLLVRARDAAGNAGADTSNAFVLANLTAVPDLPGRVAVGPGFPNPFNPSTTIQYYSPGAGPLEIVVFDLVGRRVRTLLRQSVPAGPGSVRWDGRDEVGRDLPSGVYHIQAAASGHRSWVKVTLVR